MSLRSCRLVVVAWDIEMDWFAVREDKSQVS